jgi:hypothetical protein
MGQTVTVGNTRMTVENPRVRKAVTSRGPSHTHLVANAGQYVVVDLTINGSTPEEPLERKLWSAVDGSARAESDPISTTAEQGYAFPFPAKHHDTAAIRWETDEKDVDWELSAETRETLAVEPRFTVTDLQVPRRDDQLSLEMTVANDGERDGTFMARVSLDGFSGGSIIEFPVSAGESETYTGRPEDILLYAENSGGGTLTIQYPADEGLTMVEQSVRLPETTTESKT